MKFTITLLLVLIALPQLFAQDAKTVESEIKSVTVFTQGAQIEREASFLLKEGKSDIKLSGLSPYIKKESIQIKGDGSFKILNVQQQTDFINELQKQDNIKSLQNKLEALQLKMDEENIRVQIINEKISFLQNNKKVITEGTNMTPQSFESLNSIYGSNYETLSLNKFKKQQIIKEYQKERAKLQNQLRSLHNSSSTPSGIITVTLSAKAAKNIKVKFTYVVTQANWFPSYDIRFNGTNKPLEITYKANIKQNTGIDWKDINLTLSTAKTNVSAQMPALRPHYMQFLSPPPPPPPAVSNILNIIDNDAELDEDLEITFDDQDLDQALQGRAPGIMIRGASSMKSSEPLYIVDGVEQNRNPNIDTDQISSIDVLKDKNATSVYGSRASNGVIVITTKKGSDKNSSVPLTSQATTETNRTYTVESAQSVLASNEYNIVNYKETSLDAEFEYQSIPKLRENVFLIARVPDWYKANLLSGAASVYLEDAYVGKSHLNTQQFTDTLDISFGVDNNISIKRERLSELSEYKYIGSNKKETVAYKITVRNNKPYAISTSLSDQIPVTTDKTIVVEQIDMAGATINNETGIIQWKLDLAPKASQEIIFKYSVKYPKDKKVSKQ